MDETASGRALHINGKQGCQWLIPTRDRRDVRVDRAVAGPTPMTTHAPATPIG